MEENIVLIDDLSIRDKIHTIRGVKVMLDFDLAEIYGYETKNFNRQVKNNAEKFEGEEFMFRLSDDEIPYVSRCNNFTLNNGSKRGSNIKYNPYAFTEQGIYMLMTVLRGELAVRQSRALVMAFKSMKDHIVAGKSISSQHELLQLSLQVNENRRETERIREELTELGTQMSSVMDRLGNVVERSEIAPFMLDFSRPEERREYLFLDGQPMRSDLAYMEIYGKAKRSIHIVDDYINLKTLHLLCGVDKSIRITIISDNLRGLLHASDCQDCLRENPDFHVEFKRSMGASHDRFIVLDHGTEGERLYHCGSSSKDSGNRITVISELLDPYIKTMFSKRLSELLGNPLLVL
ncbi:MAG: ORF6N domain-containing protein [Spirochaetales bacterium]|nr:ORF6N domain-containing protein [Spirochaetales bacterium]